MTRRRCGLIPRQAPCEWVYEQAKLSLRKGNCHGGAPGRREESRRILERVARETAPGGTPFVVRAAKDARDRMTAADAYRADPIEYWGTRVGRTLGFIIAIGLLVWLVYAATRGG
ncbi:hypothetical protein ACVDG8_021165 [Mesorhizobium sp. ORM8.1]